MNNVSLMSLISPIITRPKPPNLVPFLQWEIDDACSPADSPLSEPVGVIATSLWTSSGTTDQENDVAQEPRVVEATVSHCADSFLCLWENTLYLFDNL
jgi:hypothetical protein